MSGPASGLRARMALGALALLGATVAAARAGVLIHEILGHVGFGVVFGARRPIYLQVALMAGGGAGASWPRPPSPFARGAEVLGGIIAQSIAGAIAVLALRRRTPGGALDLFLRVFGAVALFGGVHYLVAGSYYGHGDSADFPHLWIPGIAIAAPVFFFALRPAGIWVGARIAREASAPRRLAIFSVVALLTAAGYTALYLILNERDFASVEARAMARARAVEEARIEKAEKIAAARAEERKALAARGEPVPASLTAAVRAADVVLTSAEIPRAPFPIEVPLALAYLFAAVLAGLAKPPDGPREVTPRDAVLALLLGGLALLAVLPLGRGVTF